MKVVEAVFVVIAVVCMVLAGTMFGPFDGQNGINAAPCHNQTK
jgi:hypothetical protein